MDLTHLTLDKLPQHKPRLPYTLYHRRDGSIMLVRCLNGGCQRVYAATEAEAVRRFRSDNK